jgi:3'-5' exonuclease
MFSRNTYKYRITSMSTRTLVFDIETVGEKWDDLDVTTQEILSRWIERAITEPEAQEAARKDLKERLGFSPLTGKILAIGLYDVEFARGVVYYESDTTEEIEDGDFILKSRTEKAMLEDFWDGAQSYDTFVTFNGRGFDVPFMNVRSAVHGMRPSQDLMDGRYLYQQKHARHIDLQDQLTFYGAMHRRPSLHLFCRAFGIESPKAGGVAGDDVASLYTEKQFETIARYNARDVRATTALYKKWVGTLAPAQFFEATE